MKLLDFTFLAPAENLACDEALLDWCEEESGEEILRFWEPREHFVVVGYANKISIEANAAACAENQIPILRRCSGGGTVLQGPGCLNYSLILKISEHEPLRGISSTNRFIMERNRAAIEKLFLDTGRAQLDARALASPSPPPKEERAGERRHLVSSSNSLTPALSPLDRGEDVESATVPGLSSAHSQLRVQGYTDLAFGGLKFSGNSQRRKKHFLIFHGTFLLHFDISLIERFLLMPSKQPDYRRKRTHSDFLTNVDLPAESVRCALRNAWHADEPLKNLPRERIELLSRDKYVTKQWNFKF